MPVPKYEDKPVDCSQKFDVGSLRGKSAIVTGGEQKQKRRSSTMLHQPIFYLHLSDCSMVTATDVSSYRSRF